MRTRVSVSWPPPGQPFSKADLDELPDDGRRYELIDGVLVVSPTPWTLHQSALLDLLMLLDSSCTDDLEVLPGPLDVELADDTVLRPDGLVIRRDRLGELYLAGMPDLVIEVMSPSTRSFDLFLKRFRYEVAGCPSYWVVDPDEPSIVAWDLIDGQYVEAGRAAGDTELSLTRPFPIVLNPGRLPQLGRVHQRLAERSAHEKGEDLR